MATLTQTQVYALALMVGLPNPRVMAAVAMAESSGRTDVVNSIGCVGLWQINQPVHVKTHPSWTVEWLKNPINNASAAKVVYKAQGLTAWQSYTDGRYGRYLSESVNSTAGGATQASYSSYTTPTGENVNLQSQVQQAGFGWNDLLRAFPPYELYKFLQGDPLPDAPDLGGTPLEGAQGAAEGLLGIAEAIQKVGLWSAQPKNWARIVYVIGGSILTVGALMSIMSNTSVGRAVKQTAAGAASVAPGGGTLRGLGRAAATKAKPAPKKEKTSE